MFSLSGTGLLEPRQGRVIFEGEDKFRLQNANYTTCAIGQDDWWVRANDLLIDKVREMLGAPAPKTE